MDHGQKVNMKLPLNNIDKTWTLFLDRDGVINHEKHEDYIHTWDEFKFYDGATEAIKIFTEKFRRILVVTNQRGVGKGYTKLDDLHTIHANMLADINLHGGHLDAIYYCSELDDDNPYRKPNPGMGLEAVKEFPDIDLSKAIMVGNTMSDMQFGRNLGVYTVFLPTTRPEVDIKDERIDAVYPSLIEFAKAL
jgi:D-glycero-D-manno-heptose 1,7-bisphosphate phosphatase